jgi:nicotinic acid phosphoribosyltransferase
MPRINHCSARDVRTSAGQARQGTYGAAHTVAQGMSIPVLNIVIKMHICNIRKVIPLWQTLFFVKTTVNLYT